jgi:hypothetical protein
MQRRNEGPSRSAKGHQPGDPPKTVPLLQVSPKIEEAHKAFRCELPQLLQHHYRRWILYHGAQRIALSDSQFDLYDQCARFGYRDDEFLVMCIMPECEDLDLQALGDRAGSGKTHRTHRGHAE